MSKIEQSITEQLQALGVQYSTQYVGETVRENNWKCDAWRVTFTRVKQPAQLPGTVSEPFDYFTGLGHREKVTGARAMSMPGNRMVKGQWVAEKPKAPHAAGVLYSLVLDGGALDTSFEYWCADFGYSSDSISAFDIYRACCDNAKKLQRIFSRAELSTFSELLQDY